MQIPTFYRRLQPHQIWGCRNEASSLLSHTKVKQHHSAASAPGASPSSSSAGLCHLKAQEAEGRGGRRTGKADLLVVWTYSDSVGELTWAGRGLDVCGAWDAVLSCSCGGGRLEICVEKQRHNSCFLLPWHEGTFCMADQPLSLKHPLFLYTQREMTDIST